MSRIKTRHPGIYYRLDSQERRRYIIWYQDSTGKGRFEHLPLGSTEKDAVNRRASLNHRISRGERVAPTKVTVSELADEWLAQKTELSPRTLEAHTWAIEKHIKRHLGRLPVSSVREDEVARMVSELRAEGKKASTINRVLSPLSGMMSYAVRRKGWLSSNPVAGLLREEKPKNDQRAMRVLSREEIEKLVKVSADEKGRLWLFLCFTGLRISEALDLEWGDIDFEAGVVHVQGTKTESAVRDVVLPGFVQTALKRQRLATPALCKYVFHAKGQQAQRRTTLRSLQRAAKRAGIGSVTQHELRHTYASILIGQGMDVTYVAHQMGHSDPGVTLRTYAKLFDPKGRMEEARQKLEAAFGA